MASNFVFEDEYPKQKARAVQENERLAQMDKMKADQDSIRRQKETLKLLEAEYAPLEVELQTAQEQLRDLKSHAATLNDGHEARKSKLVAKENEPNSFFKSFSFLFQLGSIKNRVQTLESAAAQHEEAADVLRKELVVDGHRQAVKSKEADAQVIATKLSQKATSVNMLAARIKPMELAPGQLALEWQQTASVDFLRSTVRTTLSTQSKLWSLRSRHSPTRTRN
jgi:chromosome segregation ATPase